jgi:plasmid stabilization system protein ParE
MISIQISNLGKSSLADVSEFLLFLWNIKVLQQFIDLIEKATNQLQENPHLGIPFSKNIRKIVLHKNASMYYEYNEINKTVTILLFIDNRQNPKDYLKLL